MLTDAEVQAKRRVPKQYTIGASDGSNAQKAWLDGFDTAVAVLLRDK